MTFSACPESLIQLQNLISRDEAGDQQRRDIRGDGQCVFDPGRDVIRKKPEENERRNQKDRDDDQPRKRQVGTVFVIRARIEWMLGEGESAREENAGKGQKRHNANAADDLLRYLGTVVAGGGFSTHVAPPLPQ